MKGWGYLRSVKLDFLFVVCKVLLDSRHALRKPYHWTEQSNHEHRDGRDGMDLRSENIHGCYGYFPRKDERPPLLTFLFLYKN